MARYYNGKKGKGMISEDKGSYANLPEKSKTQEYARYDYLKQRGYVDDEQRIMKRRKGEMSKIRKGMKK